MHVRVSRLVFAVGTLLPCACALFLSSCSSSKVAASTGAADTVPRAAVATAKRDTIRDTLSVAGEFIPYQEVELHAKVAGYVQKMYVDIGDHVKAGQVLAVLEVPELNAQVAGAQAGVRHSSEEIIRARNEVARAQANHDALHAAAQRLEAAAKARPGLIAQQELDDAQAKDRASEAQVEGAKSALAASTQQLEVSRAGQTQVSALQDYSRIVAPFDGVVTWRYADKGALIQAGTSNSSSLPVVKIAQVDTLRLRVPVPESVAAKVHAGMPATVHVQADDLTLNTTVKRFTSSLDRSTRTMQVEFDIPNPGQKLAPGMYADVNLEVATTPNAITIPVQALSQSGTTSSVLIVDSSNRVDKREVQTGAQDSDKVQVVKGLVDGDRVIVGNLGAFKPGDIVKPRPASIENGRAE